MKLTVGSGASLAAAAASLVITGAFIATPAAAKSHKIHCSGINACKGHGACKTAANACKGKNACKGQGFVLSSKHKCEAKGGKIT